MWLATLGEKVGSGCSGLGRCSVATLGAPAKFCVVPPMERRSERIALTREGGDARVRAKRGRGVTHHGYRRRTGALAQATERSYNRCSMCAGEATRARDVSRWLETSSEEGDTGDGCEAP